jgi:hypothetical protein
MLEPARDLGLEHEPVTALRVVGPLGLDLLERHFTVKFLIHGHGVQAQAAVGVRPADPEPCRGRSWPNTHAPGRGRLGMKALLVDGSICGDLESCQADVQIGISYLPEPLTDRSRDREDHQAPFEALAALLELPPHQAVEQGQVGFDQGTALEEDLRQRPGSVLLPALKSRDQVALIDQSVLQRQDAEDQVAVGVTHGPILF